MNTKISFTKHLPKTFGLCAAALSLAALPASALEISGMVKVNGAEKAGVLIAAYDCADSRELGYTYSGATVTNSGSVVNFSMTVASENVRLELYYSDSPDTVPIGQWCRGYVDCGQIIPADGKAIVNSDMSCGVSTEGPGVRGMGYWKNHPEAWPVDQLTLGGRVFTKMQLLTLLRLGEKGDKTKHMLRELVAAKLNVAAGNDASCVQESIDMADSWLARFPVCSGVRASSMTWKRIMGVVKTLADYNDGELCAPAANEGRDEDGGDNANDEGGGRRHGRR